MSYAARTDLVPGLMSERELITATNNGDASAVAEVTSVTSAKLAEADAEVDAWVGVRYELPLTDVPSIIVQLAARIARYRLLTIGGLEPAKWITTDYEQARADLRAIAKGDMKLGLTPAGEAPATSASGATRVRATSTAPKLGLSNTSGY